MAPRFVRGVALRGAHVDGEPRSKTCSGCRRKAAVRAGDVSDLHPTARAASMTKGARRTSSRGSIRRRVGFLRSRPSTRARARRSSKGDRRSVRGSQSRHQAPSQSDAWNPAPSKATSDAAWATMQLWSPVSGSDRHSVVRRKATDGSAARPRGKRGWRGRRSRWARAHDRSCGRSRTTTSKPERTTPRETGALHRPDSRRG
jgi:hypothetical protein